MYKVINQEKELLRRKRISETMKRKGLTPPKYTWCKIGNKLGIGNKGKPKSEKHRMNISKSLTGRHLSPEHKAKSLKGLIHKFGSEAAHWKGGKQKRNEYNFIRQSDWYRYEHRLIVEQYIKRHLTKTEIIHHINNIKTDNRLENLYIFPNQSTHSKFHFLKNKPQLVSNIRQFV